jgi:hypothetical protein
MYDGGQQGQGAGLNRIELRHGRACPGHPRRPAERKSCERGETVFVLSLTRRLRLGVDARNKRGHDGFKKI